MSDVPTAEGINELWRVVSGDASDTVALTSLWSLGVLDVIDRERLVRETREPLELRASEERPILENAVQEAADEALAVDLKDNETFNSKRRALERLISSLRPHRVAAARRRTGDALIAELTPSPIGDVVPTSLGAAIAEAAAAFDRAAPLSESVAEYRAASSEADVKTHRLEQLYEQLPESTARPAIAAALADLDDDTARAVDRYEEVRTALGAEAAGLTADGLDPAAIAALLLMNRNEDNTTEFLDAYQLHRDRGFDPAEAVEFALAGLMTEGEVGRVRAVTRRLGLPISITAGLLNRRDDGPEVYEQLRDELATYTTSDSARTIAGVLAMSLEPSQAMRRWLEARDALHELGLVGSYADVAAAFGASDPRGPRRFALAYAAQRRALGRQQHRRRRPVRSRTRPRRHERTERQLDRVSDPVGHRVVRPVHVLLSPLGDHARRLGFLRLGAGLPGHVVVPGSRLVVGRRRRIRFQRRVIVGRVVVERRQLRRLQWWRRVLVRRRRRLVTSHIESSSNARIVATARLKKRRQREASGHVHSSKAHERPNARACGRNHDRRSLPVPGVRDGRDPSARRETSPRPGSQLTTTSARAFDKLSVRQHPDGIVAVAPVWDPSLEELAGDLTLAAESIEKPGNLGAMFRTADAAGAGLLIADPNVDPFNPNVVRASQGALFSVPFAVTDADTAIAWSLRRGSLFVATPDADVDLWDADLTGVATIVIGSEHEGVSAAWLESGSPVRIPMAGLADSLNASVSAAIMLFEAVRQRR